MAKSRAKDPSTRSIYKNEILPKLKKKSKSRKNLKFCQIFA